ncbi:MAG: oligoribonuclease [Gammaproteobacteria bacterium]|nr:oligoribonuclease [Gammaproteobacteria bacterium]
MSTNDDNLVWIDLEMTGLNPDSDQIIEIATIVTDKELNILAEGPMLAIHQEKSTMDAMDDWNTKQHGGSGLTKRVLESQTSMRDAELQTIAFLKTFIDAGKSPMCGNSICQDRRFLFRLMPELEAYFHYRNLDVSTLKELSRRWAPSVYSGFNKKGSHLALDDIKESIEELQYYRKTFIRE